MNKQSPERAAYDTETILMALDQVSQTIEVMTSVVNRLRSYVEQQGEALQREGGAVDAPPQPRLPQRQAKKYPQAVRTVH